MLVLSRKVGEKIRIGDNIFVTLVAISGAKVRLGFDAPTEIPIVREEIDKPDEEDESNDPDPAPEPVGQIATAG